MTGRNRLLLDHQFYCLGLFLVASSNIYTGNKYLNEMQYKYSYTNMVEPTAKLEEEGHDMENLE